MIAPFPSAHAQNTNENPSYVTDSPRARDAIERISMLVLQDNLAEASRLADEIIVDLGDQLVDSSDQSTLYITVRDRVNQLLSGSPRLSAHYRSVVTPRANKQLENHEWRLVWNNAWHTEPGFTASIRLAQTQLENRLFHDAQRTLQELLDHPDAPERGVDATALAQQLARYLDTDGALQLASTWADLSGVERMHLARIESPIDPHPPQYSALPWTTNRFAGTSPRRNTILPRALQSAELTPIVELDAESSRMPQRSGAAQIPSPWTFPTVAGGRVYTNDGFTISCFDRFTLRLLWRHIASDPVEGPQSSARNRARLGGLLMDSSTVSVDHGTLFAAIGLARGGNQSNEGTVIAMDAETGKKRWAVELAQMDPLLAESNARGSIAIDADTVVIAARKNSRNQRLVGMNLVGLNRYSGRLKWIRPIGSAGSLPFQQSGEVAHSGVVRDGVIYWSDAIGLMTAIEIDSGRVLWVHRLPSPELYSRKSRPVWSATSPVFVDDKLFALSPIGNELFEIDPDTGAALAQRTPQPIGQVTYIVACADSIACIGETEIAFYDAENFASSGPRRSLALGVGEEGIRGRVIALDGDQIAVPLQDKVAFLNPNNPEHAEYLDLDSTGNLLVLDGQVLVVDEAMIHSHLSWEIASEILQTQIRETSDPNASITLAELARSASRSDKILPAIDTAISLVQQQTPDERTRTRTRLFEMLHTMISAPANNGQSALDQKIVDTMLDRMGALASNHDQIVAHRFALGTHREMQTRYQEALSAYQSILTQQALKTTMWEGEGFRVRAELEASKRVRAVLEITGTQSYQIYDQLASQELDGLVDSDDPWRFERLAQKYPWSIAAAMSWERAAGLWALDENHQSAVQASHNGLRVARLRHPTAIPGKPNTSELLAGHVVNGLLAMNRNEQARSFISAFQTQFPQHTPVHAGARITLEALDADPGIARSQPILGQRIARVGSPALITGSPIVPGHRTDVDSVLVFVPQYNQTRMLRAGSAGLTERWSRTVRSAEPPTIPWNDREHTLVAWSPINQNQPGILESIETETGTTRWKITGLRTKLRELAERNPDPVAQSDQEIPTPNDGPVPIDQLLIVTDGLTVVIADRVGRAMGVDMGTGRILWNAALPVNRLYDLDLSSSTLALCGTFVSDDDRAIHNTQIIGVVDPRTGDPIRDMDQLGVSMPSWVRVTEERTIIASTGSHILSFDIDESELNWVFTNEDQSGHGHAGWVSGQQLIVIDDVYNKLFSIDRNTGVLLQDTLSWIVDRGWVDIRTHDDRVVVSCPSGLELFDHAGKRLGVDPLYSGRQFAAVAYAKDRAVFLRRPELDSADQITSTLVMFDTHNGKIVDLIELSVPSEINRQATSIEVLDARIVVGFGEVSIVLDVPVGEL